MFRKPTNEQRLIEFALHVYINDLSIDMRGHALAVLKEVGVTAKDVLAALKAKYVNYDMLITSELEEEAKKELENVL